MSEPSRAQLETALQGYSDPYLGQDLLAAKCVKQLSCTAGQVELQIELGFPAAGYQAQLAEALRECLLAVAGVQTVKVTVGWKITAHQVQKTLKTLAGVKNIIAVASGKGGVGKSTTSVNLALALLAEGATVGILDADVYGPSQPLMLGAYERPNSPDGKSIEPVLCHGLQVMSLGYLLDQDDAPMIWRGPMATQALMQLLNDTRWKELDYLIIDLPPGTGDIQLTMSQKIPVAGAVIVTTPQDIALLDARKGLVMFEKVSVPVLGVVENMSVHVCSNCGHAEPIFGQGGGERMAEQYGVAFLGGLPLDMRIREQADNGCPTVAADPEGAIAQLYRQIARKAAAQLSLRPRDYSHRFPTISIKP